MDASDTSTSTRVQMLQADIEVEECKRKNWAEENIRRKHKYIPFLFNFLKEVAKRGKLQSLVAEAVKKPQVPDQV